jgi:hypothetical protein
MIMSKAIQLTSERTTTFRTREIATPLIYSPPKGAHYDLHSEMSRKDLILGSLSGG